MARVLGDPSQWAEVDAAGANVENFMRVDLFSSDGASYLPKGLRTQLLLIYFQDLSAKFFMESTHTQRKAQTKSNLNLINCGWRVK